MCSNRGQCEHSGSLHPCKCQLRGFLRAALLLLISQQPGYGYTLQQQLLDTDLVDEVDIGTLYRNLRFLEEAGYIKSEWQASESGPEKRVYAISPQGKERLRQWKAELLARKQQIEVFLALLEQEDS